MKHFYLFVFGLLFSSIVTSQAPIDIQNNEDTPFYFYTIHYGFNNDVYISDVYSLDIERNDVYKYSKDRFEDVKDYIIENGIAKEIQSGYEKNYFKKEQAETERKYLMYQFKNQDYKIITFKYK